MLSLEGKQLGNYDVIKRIRVGGMGAVYEGKQRTAFDRRVAIKVILGDYAADRDMRRRFMREARTIARLQHPHVLPLIEFGDEQGILYLVMPFIDGGTLTSYMRRHLLDLDEVDALYTQLLDAVEHAHDEGLIHRDIKSSNVLLEMRRSGPPHIYLADFGLVRLQTLRTETTSQPGKPIPLDQVPGTPHYMAPEQTRGIITTQTDIYALGVLLYQMLTGSLPYNDPDEVRVIQMHLHAPIPVPSEVDGSLPHELDTVIRQAMAKRPEDRYSSVAELRQAFKQALEGPIEFIPDEELSPEPPTLPAPRRTHPIPPPVPAPYPTPYEHGSEAINLQPRRLPREGTPVGVREARERARITDNVRDHARNTARDSIRSPHVRVTEEPFGRKKRPPRRRLLIPILASALVTVLLLSLLIVPRAFGISILPAGIFPGGSDTIGTVTIQARQKQESNVFILTATNSIQNTNLEKRSIPARNLQSKASGGQTVNTSGLKTITGSKATGTAIFINPSGRQVIINPDAVFTANNIRFHLPQPLLVPAHKGDTDGRETGLLEALDVGAAGNITPHALDGNMCCNDTIKVSNDDAFSGGQDNQVQKIVARADLDGVKLALKDDLQTQVQQNLQKQLKAGEIMAGSPIFNFSTSSDVPVGDEADQVKVTVKVDAAVTVYMRAAAEDAARQLLINQARHDLAGSFDAYQLRGQITIDGTPEPSRQTTGKGQPVFLNVSVHGLWVYTITDQQVSQWRQAIKNTSSTVATTYLKSQPGVASVKMQLPGNGDQLPADVDNIRVVVE